MTLVAGCGIPRIRLRKKWMDDPKQNEEYTFCSSPDPLVNTNRTVSTRLFTDPDRSFWEILHPKNLHSNTGPSVEVHSSE